MNQAALFEDEDDDAPPTTPAPRELTRKDLVEARVRADVGLDRAAANAGKEWGDMALAAFLAYGEQHGGVFSTEDVRHANPQLPAPRSPTAWGAVPRRAKLLGKIEFGGYAPSKDPKSHGAPGNLWRWTGKAP